MEKNTTNLLLGVVALGLFFVGYQLFIQNKITQENNIISTNQVQNVKKQEGPLISPSMTNTPDFSFVSWSNSIDTINENPLTFLLYEKSKEDVDREKIVYTNSLNSYVSFNIKEYEKISESFFGKNNYEIWDNKKDLNRVFILKNPKLKTEIILVLIPDKTKSVPTYIDLSSISFK